MATVSPVSTRALCDACERLGLSVDALLTEVGLDRSALRDPDRRIPREAAGALWAAATRASGDPELALHAVEALEFGAYRTLDFLAANAATIGEAYVRIARYFPLVDPEARVRILETAEGYLCRLGTARPATPQLRPSVEYTLGAIVLRTRAAAALNYPLVAARFHFPRPATIASHERVFGPELHFGCRHSEVSVAPTVWRTPIAGAQPALFAVLEDHAQRLLHELSADDSLLARVRESLTRQLRGGEPTLPQVARAMAMSTRTLQRRLREEGVTFATLLDEQRRVLAEAYLAQPDVALGEVAFLLGFKDQSSFTRAFKRWFGETPSKYRGGGPRRQETNRRM